MVKCYYFEDIPSANDCGSVAPASQHWLVLADRTVITIYTPVDYTFKESEIPITITTEGASSEAFQGITLDPLIQRYMFHIYTYDKIHPGTSLALDAPEPKEIYFTEWIPDAIEMV